jgi:hypothetical protein
MWHDPVADTLNISVNNGAATTAARSTGTWDGTGAFTIGAASGGTTPFDGIIDEVGLWIGRIPDSTERTTLYNGGAPYPYESIVGVVGKIQSAMISRSSFHPAHAMLV